MAYKTHPLLKGSAIILRKGTKGIFLLKGYVCGNTDLFLQHENVQLFVCLKESAAASTAQFVSVFFKTQYVSVSFQSAGI